MSDPAPAPPAEAAPAPAAPPAAPVEDAADVAALAKLKTQIEFYFSDANFRRDKFLRAKAAEDADGFVSLDVLATFNRVKTTTTDPARIARALEDSTELELSEDRAAVRRSKPLPEEDKSTDKSVYVKGPFAGNATLEALHEWASASSGGAKVARVLMRRMRQGDKSFKGSAFFEFDTEAGAAALIASHAAGTLVYALPPGATIAMAAASAAAAAAKAAAAAAAAAPAAVPTAAAAAAPSTDVTAPAAADAPAAAPAAAATVAPATVEAAAAAAPEAAAPTAAGEAKPVLKCETMKAYFERKKKDREARKAKKALGLGGGGAGGNAAAAAAAIAAAVAAGGVPGQKKKFGRDETEDVAADDDDAPTAAGGKGGKAAPRTFTKGLTPGVVLKVTGFGAAASVDSLQTYLNTLGELKFAEYDPSSKTAHARFENAADAAKAAAAIAEGGPNVKAATASDAPVAAVLTGDEETAYWEKIWAHQLSKFNAQRAPRGGRGGGGGGRGRGGRGGGFGGRGGGRGGGGRGGGFRGGRGGGGGAGGKRPRDGGDAAPPAKKAAPAAAV